jgi:RNA-binding protein 8A
MVPWYTKRYISSQKKSNATLASQRTFPLACMVVAEVDAMNFDPEEDDLMDNDMEMDDGNAENISTPAPKLKLTIMNGTSRLGDVGDDNTKRSFRKETDGERNNQFVA